ncbi:MAG: hypothetical protein ACE5IF_04280 [Candidatus Bathyarchaeia archaeon]
MPAKKVGAVFEREIPLEWRIPEDLETHFATNIVISHSKGEFFLTFFEVVPPIILGDVDKLAALKSVPAQAVARIAIAADRMEGMIDALKRNLESYRKSKELKEKESV